MIKDINIHFDKPKLINEISNLHLKPSHSNNWWRATTEESKRFWFKTDTWLKTIVNDIHLYPEIQRLNKIFNSDIVYVYKQLANSKLPKHRDWDVITAVNILLSDNAAPITFNNKEYFYKNALIDVSQTHSVKAYPFDRLLLKFAWHDKSFDDVYKEFVKKCLI